MAANSARISLLATLEDQVTKKVNHMDSGFKRLQGTLNVLKGAGFLIIAQQLVHYTRQAIDSTVATARLGDQLTTTSATFDRLTRKAGIEGPEALNTLRASVQGSISDLVLMQKVGAALDSGLTFEQANTALRFLRAYSISFGKDFNRLVQTIFTGLQRGSVLMLDDAGIILSATDDMFKGLEGVEQKSALVGEAIRQMSEKLPALESGTLGAATATDQLAAEWANFAAQIGQKLDPIVTAVTNRMKNLVAASKEVLILLRFLDAVQGGKTLLNPTESQVEALRGAQTYEEYTRILKGFIDAQVDAQKEIDKTTEALKASENQQLAARKAAAELARNQEALLGRAPRQLAGPDTQRPVVGLEAILDDGQIEGADTNWDALLRTIVEGMRQIPLESQDAITSFYADLERAATEATGDRAAIAFHEIQIWEQAMLHRANLVEAGEATITRITETASKNRQRILDEEQVRRILLIFDADASQVQSEADLAAHNIGLLVRALGDLSPAVGSVIRSVQNIVTGAAAGGLAGQASVLTGAVGVFGTLVGVMGNLFNSADQAAAELAHVRDILDDSADAAARFAEQQTLATYAALEDEFRTLVGEFNRLRGGMALISESAPLEDLLSVFTEWEAHIQTMPNLTSGTRILLQEIGQVAESLSSVTEEEIRARENQTSLLISSIRDQEKEVLRALEDAMSSQKQASLRAVRLQFDLQESALRQRFVGRFAGAGTDSLEVDRVLAEAQREVSALQLAEQAEANRLLAQIDAAYEASRQEVDSQSEAIVNAIRAAGDDTSLDFDVSLANRLSELGIQLDNAFTQAGEDSAGQIGDAVRQEFVAVIAAVRGAQVETAAQTLVLSDFTSNFQSLGTDLAAINSHVAGIGEVNRQLSHIGFFTVMNQQNTLTTNTLLNQVRDAVHDPSWARGKSFGGGGGGGGGGLSITVNVDGVQVGSGASVTPADVRNIFRSGFEDQIIDSLQDGALGKYLYDREAYQRDVARIGRPAIGGG